MSEQQLDEILQTVRKQGRAAVAAQAAAEACLEKIERFEQRSDELLPLLLPVIDALDRVAREAADVSRMERSRILRRVEALIERDRERRLERVLDGVRLLERQMKEALDVAGVEIDRQVGQPVDATRHRVVRVQSREEDRPGIVVEVVRPGYRSNGRVLREADVVATSQRRES